MKKIYLKENENMLLIKSPFNLSENFLGESKCQQWQQMVTNLNGENGWKE